MGHILLEGMLFGCDNGQRSDLICSLAFLLAWVKVAEKGGEKSVGAVGESNECINPDGTTSEEDHVFEFNPEVRLVCEICGIVGSKVENMWERDVSPTLHIYSIIPSVICLVRTLVCIPLLIKWLIQIWVVSLWLQYNSWDSRCYCWY